MRYQYKREPLTNDEVNSLTQACQTAEEKLVVWTLIDTGMRVSEVAEINKQSLDLQAHRLTVYGKGSGGHGKKRRTLSLSPRLRGLLEPHIVANDTFGVTVRTIQRILHRVANRAGILRATSPHVMRHTFAVNALRKGVNLRALQGWLGHESVRTTELYLNFAPEDIIHDVESKVF